MTWPWIVLSIIGGLALAVVLAGLSFHFYVVKGYLRHITRVFEERPLFIIPRGQPVEGAEDVTLTTPDGLGLRGCYLRTAGPRKGVILFGLEFGSNRWGCTPYTEFLREAGYDIFTFEMRGQGDSPAHEGYEPLQWVTDFEVSDFRTALEYLKARPDRDPRGVGFFGLSKGGGAGLIAAAGDPFVRCVVTDGIFSTLGTMVPYMRQWVYIFVTVKLVARNLPVWYLRYLARLTIRSVEQKRRCHFSKVEKGLPRLAPRPLLMIHGGADNYIKPDMARALLELAGGPKELWLVEGAKHNQSIHVATEEYRRRVRAFFDTHLAAPAAPLNGAAHREGAPAAPHQQGR